VARRVGFVSHLCTVCAFKKVVYSYRYIQPRGFVARVARRVGSVSHLYTGCAYDIVITNIVWCMAYQREVEGGVVYCPTAVQ